MNHRTNSDTALLNGHPDILPGSPEQLMEERIARLAEEMIDLCTLAADPEQRPLFQREWRGISQILLRAQLILSSLKGEEVDLIERLIRALDDPRRPGQMFMVQNG